MALMFILISLIKMYYSGIYSHCFFQSPPCSRNFYRNFCRMHFVNSSFLAGINVVIEYLFASSACKFVSRGNVAVPLEHL